MFSLVRAIYGFHDRCRIDHLGPFAHDSCANGKPKVETFGPAAW